MSKQPTFTIINQANSDYCLAIRGRKVVLNIVDPIDRYQQWIRMDTGTKDQEGQPAFALVNRATNEVMKQEGTTGTPVSLVKYDAGSQDKSILWTVSKYDEQDFRYIRQVSSMADHLATRSHVVEDGRLLEHLNGTHISERWKLVHNYRSEY